MAKIVKVQHTGGGSISYRLRGQNIRLTEGKQADIPEELYERYKNKLILVSDLEFLKISPDYKGEPEPFSKPRPINPLAQRALEEVEKDSTGIDDGLEALRAKLKELESEWVGRSTPEIYVERYGKNQKKTALAQEIIRLKGLIAEAEI